MPKVVVDRQTTWRIVAVDCTASDASFFAKRDSARFICDQLRSRDRFEVEQGDLDRLRAAGHSASDAKRQAVVDALAREWSIANDGVVIAARGLW